MIRIFGRQFRKFSTPAKQFTAEEIAVFESQAEKLRQFNLQSGNCTCKPFPFKFELFCVYLFTSSLCE